MPTVVRVLAATGLAGAVVLAGASSAAAADGSIVNVERTDVGVRVSVDVPADAEVDLAGVTATVNGTDYPAEAVRITDGASFVRRTTILAIDTSNSMADDGKFDAAKLAATTFLDSVPDDVEVGIVSFDSAVRTRLDPTTDRDEARDVIDGLTLSSRTLLYDGVLAAVDAAGDDGQRSVLLLSDGADTSDTPIAEVTAAIEDSGVLVDVVSLEQTGKALDALDTIAGDDGELISADSGDLAGVFSDRADVLARQVGVSITVPPGTRAQDLTISVTLPSSVGDVVADSTVLALDGEPAPTDTLGAIPDNTARSVTPRTPDWLIYAGVGTFGLGLLVGGLMLVPARPVPMSAEARVSTYTAGVGGPSLVKTDNEPDLTQQAADVVAGVLKHSEGLDVRIAKRLEAAGSNLTSSEWLLAHAGAFVGITVVGLLAGQGSLVVGIVFMVIGVVAPWMYLGFRASRRRKAFDSMLPETLQLMSGSLSAGLSLMQSVDTIVREGTDPVASEFKRVLVETRIGVQLEDALEGVADRFDSRDFRWVVMAIRIQRQVGGNLAELLNTVAETMREREYMRRQVAALSAEGKLSAIVLGALPPFFMLYLLLAQPDYIEPLFTTSRGLIMIVGATLWLGIGVFWMSKLVKVEV